jgi:hypothetical protein
MEGLGPVSAQPGCARVARYQLSVNRSAAYAAGYPLLVNSYSLGTRESNPFRAMEDLAHGVAAKCKP